MSDVTQILQAIDTGDPKAAAEAMRRILVDHARAKNADKRGGDRERQPLDPLDLAAPRPEDDIVALDEALSRLKKIEPQAAAVVQLRYFSGLSLPEIASIMDLSPRSVDRQWAYARAWLHRELRAGGEK